MVESRAPHPKGLLIKQRISLESRSNIFKYVFADFLLNIVLIDPCIEFKITANSLSHRSICNNVRRKEIFNSNILYHALDTMREILQLMRTKSSILYNYTPQWLCFRNYYFVLDGATLFYSSRTRI